MQISEEESDNEETRNEQTKFLQLKDTFITTVSPSGQCFSLIRYTEDYEEVHIMVVSLNVTSKNGNEGQGANGVKKKSTDRTGTGSGNMDSVANEFLGISTKIIVYKAIGDAEMDSHTISDTRFGVTDTGEVIIINLSQKQIFLGFRTESADFSNYNFYNTLSGKMKSLFDKYKTDSTKEDSMRVFHNIHHIVISNTYIVIWDREEIYSFRFNIDDTEYFGKETKMPAIGNIAHCKKIHHKPITGYQNITLSKIMRSSHPDRFLILYEFKSSCNVVVWDIVTNSEVSSFSSREGDRLMFFAYSTKNAVHEAIKHEIKFQEYEDYILKYGKTDLDQKEEDDIKKYMTSQTGYLFFDKYYVNLDKMVPMPFLKFTDENRIDRYQWSEGPRVNIDETLILVKGSVFSVYSFQDIFFRKNREKYALQRLDACKYFVDRRCILADMSMEDDKVLRILDMMAEEPDLYLMILAQDQKGLTALEEALDNNSPKVVETFMEMLREVRDFKLSRVLYKKFDEIFDMGLDAFRSFLNICWFRTEQMEMMKKMESKGAETTIRMRTESSMLGERFNLKFLADKKIKDGEKSGNEDLNDFNASSLSNNDSDHDSRDDETLMSDISIPEIDETHQNEIDDGISVERRIDVKAIEFDWILTSAHGTKFLEQLSETNSLSYFDIDVIKNIVMFQWQIIRKRIIIFLFFPFLLFFLIFALYTTWLINEQEDENKKGDWGTWHTTTFAFGVAILLFQLFFIYVEIKQLSFHGWHYFTYFWNVLDILSIFINSAVVVMDFLKVDVDDINSVSCIAILIMWFRLFYYLRIFQETAYLISMIQAIILEMKFFVVALLIAILAFANTFYILGRNAEGEENFTGDNIWDAFIFAYKMGLGDFDTEAFNTDDEGLIWFLWFLNTLIILIILLNLVIAIMGDTFDRVQETQEATMLQEFTSIMRENEFVFNRNRLFKNVKYIVIISPEKAEGGVTSNWEGKLNQLKRFLEDSSEKHISHLKKMEKKLEKMIEQGLDEKLKPTEEKINQKIAALDLRLQKANKVFSQYPVKELIDKILKLEGRN